MAELLKVNVTKDELDNGVIPANMVLCEEIFNAEGAKTKSGIIYGININLTYGDPDNPNDASAHQADMAQVALKVYKLPEKLYFNPDYPDKSMTWETEQELCEGDLVWTNIIESLNAVTLVCEGKNYKLIPYNDIYCAKREIWVDKWKGTKKTVVVMLNGYTLCEQIKKKAKSALDVTSQDHIEENLVKISFLGQANTRHLREEYTDFKDIQVGDTVVVDKKFKPFPLERQLYASKFSDEKLYVVVPRRRILMVVKREA